MNESMSQSSPREEADRCGKESNQHNGNRLVVGAQGCGLLKTNHEDHVLWWNSSLHTKIESSWRHSAALSLRWADEASVYLSWHTKYYYTISEYFWSCESKLLPILSLKHQHIEILPSENLEVLLINSFITQEPPSSYLNAKTQCRGS